MRYKSFIFIVSPMLIFDYVTCSPGDPSRRLEDEGGAAT